jgi:hypothetical protein
VSGFLRRRSSSQDPTPDTSNDLEVADGERVLAHARTPSGAEVAITAQALYLPRRSGEPHRVPWESVVTARWDSPVLEVLETGATAPVSVLLEQPGRVPEAVRERVTASIVVSERVSLGGDDSASAPGAQIIGRRGAEGGGLHWTVLFDKGLDPEDPGLRAAADRELARMRDWYGT